MTATLCVCFSIRGYCGAGTVLLMPAGYPN